MKTKTDDRRRQDERIQVYVGAEGKARLERAARKHGTSVSRMVSDFIFDESLVEPQPPTFRGWLRYRLGR